MFDFMIKYNFFKFENQFYLQIHDTAMGTTFAPNYSGVFLGNFENTALNLRPIIWKRFYDANLAVLTHGETALRNFHTYLSTLYPTIIFDITYSTKEINVLDTTVPSTSTPIVSTNLQSQTYGYLCFITC